MATINRFEDLEIWQKARKLCQFVNSFTSSEKFSKDFDLKNQIKRSSGSCMDNIAEGFEREGNREFRNFLSIAKGSVGETRSQMYRALDLGYILKEQFDVAVELCEELSKNINGLMAYLKKSEYKGNKFGEPEIEYGLKGTDKID